MCKMNCFYENSFECFGNHLNKSKFLKMIAADSGVAKITVKGLGDHQIKIFFH